MIDLIFSMPWGASLLLAFTLTLLVSLTALWLLHRLMSPIQLREHHDLAGVSLQIVGVIYAILLGFIVSYVQGINTRASLAVEREAESLIVLNRNVSLLDPALGAEVRKLTFAYVQSAMQHDWNELAHQRLPKASRVHLSGLYRAIHAYRPTDDHAMTWYAECVSTLNRVADARTERIGSAMSGLGIMLWTLLIVGGGVIVTGLMFFGATYRRLHQVMIAMLSGVVTFLLMVVLDLEHPFAGGIAVGVEPFQRVIDILSNLPN